MERRAQLMTRTAKRNGLEIPGDPVQDQAAVSRGAMSKKSAHWQRSHGLVLLCSSITIPVTMIRGA